MRSARSTVEEPVRDEDRRASVNQRLERRLNVALGFRIQCRGRFVENQYRRVLEQRARDREPWRWPPESLTPFSPTSVWRPRASVR